MCISEIKSLYNQIVNALEEAGKVSPYSADANEPDPRYRAYGVRAPQKKAIFKQNRQAIRALAPEQQVELGMRLIHSKIGEQQTIGFYVLQMQTDFFRPDRFDRLDDIVRTLYGWSKVDEFVIPLLQDIFFAFPEELTPFIKRWNRDAEPWARRTSVVLFTRRVAKSGRFTDLGLEMCDNLKHAPEDLVRKGVGWALKDMMKVDKGRILPYVADLRRQNVSRVIISYALRDLSQEERAISRPVSR